MSVKSQKAQRIAKRRKQKQLTNLGLISLGGLILIALAAWLIKSNQPAPKVPVLVNGAPSLKVDKEKVDLGDKRLGSIAAVSFVVSNQGDQPLKFGEVPYVEVKEGC